MKGPVRNDVVAVEDRPPRLSPDGQRIAVVVRGSDLDDLWVYELTRDTWDRVTFEGNNGFPLWSRDGTRLTYNTDRTGAVAIESKRRDGGGSPETLVQSTFAPRVFPFSWSPEGTLAFVALRPQQDIYVVRPSSKPTPFVATPSFEGAPAFSPDGRFVAYVSNESGRNEIQLRSFPGSGDKVTVSKEGGNEPVWASVGRELFYRAGDALMAVDVTTSPELRVGAPAVCSACPTSPARRSTRTSRQTMASGSSWSSGWTRGSRRRRFASR